MSFRVMFHTLNRNYVNELEFRHSVKLLAFYASNEITFIFIIIIIIIIAILILWVLKL